MISINLLRKRQGFALAARKQTGAVAAKCRKWLELLGRADLLEKKKNSTYFVCCAHFHTSSILIKKKLKNDALPTLLLANQPQEEGPTCSTLQPNTSQTKQTKLITSKTQTTNQDDKSTQTLKSRLEGISRKRKLLEELKDSKSKQHTNVSPKDQDPVSRGTIDQCRFCGEFTKCVPVSNKPYITNITTLAFNDITVQLDFNDETLPKTVCQACDAKLREMHDFVKVVKAAQESLINVAEPRQVYVEIDPREDYETIVVKTEYDDDEGKDEYDGDDNESREGIVDSLTIGETIYIKEAVTQKRKSKTKTASPKKTKKAKVTEVKSETEDAELIIDIKEEVIEIDTNDLESDTGCFLSDTGYSVSDTGYSVSDTGCSVIDTGTDAKPTEVELATSALVFEMRSDGSGYS